MFVPVLKTDRAEEWKKSKHASDVIVDVVRGFFRVT